MTKAVILSLKDDSLIEEKDPDVLNKDLMGYNSSLLHLNNN